MDDEEKKYFVIWDIRHAPNGVLSHEIPQGCGAADAMAFFPVTFLDGGKMAIEQASIDGRTDKPLANKDLFNIWITLAHTLASELDLKEEYRELCAKVLEDMQDIANLTIVNDSSS